MREPSKSTPPKTAAEHLSCLECGRSWLDESERWRLYVMRDDPSEVLLYCATCAAREFG